MYEKRLEGFQKLSVGDFFIHCRYQKVEKPDFLVTLGHICINYFSVWSFGTIRILPSGNSLLSLEFLSAVSGSEVYKSVR